MDGAKNGSLSAPSIGAVNSKSRLHAMFIKTQEFRKGKGMDEQDDE